MIQDAPWRRYFVIFADTDQPHWWNRYLRPGYEHCYVLVWDGAVWLYVDPMSDRLRVTILDYYEPEHPAVWVDDPSARVIEAWPEYAGSLRLPWLGGFVTCVELCKALLGIRAPFVLTPWQLAQYLRRRRRDNETARDEEGEGPSRLRGREGARSRTESRARPQERRDRAAAEADPEFAARRSGKSAVGQ